MSFPRYPEYKDSGVEWLGGIPAHWRFRKIAWDVPYSVGWTPPSGREDYYDGDFLWVTIADMKKPVIHDTKSKITKEAIADRGGRLSPEGSMLFSFKLTVGAVCFLGKPAYTNEAIASFEPNKKIDLKYWSFAAPEFIPKFGRENIYGALLLNQELIGSVRFYAPSFDEQKLIATFLDHETARIDALVAEQQRLIELLKEKRQAVISHAVTKGLNPDVPMKDSGVEWLGEVPAHWKVCKLCLEYDVELGKMLDGKRITGASLVAYLRNQDVQWGKINTVGLPEMDIDDHERQRYTIKRGDILVCEGGDVGRAAIWTGPDDRYGYQKALHRLRPLTHHSQTPSFFLNALFAAKVNGYFDQDESKATIAHLPAEKFRQLRFAFPPAAEQCGISSHLAELDQSLTALLSDAEHSVVLLQERRSALISAAVTGKIDVRGWQPPPGSSSPNETTAKEPA